MLHAVIPAGGSGTRLWPLSRADHPKFLLPLTGTTASLLQATVQRLARLAPAEQTLVVTGRPHAAAVAAQLPGLPPGNILAEPAPRDSGGAIGLAAAVIADRDPGAVMGSFAADHLVQDQARFETAVRAAVDAAGQGRLMTVGMRPTRPETGYGYVQCGDPVGDGAIRRVRRFKEKPDHDLAVRFVDSGDYLWNAGMFIWRVDVFLAELARQQPMLHDGLVRIAAAWDTPRRADVLGEVWPGLPRLAVEYAVMEGAAQRGLVATVPGDFGWTDIGDFRNLGDLLPGDEAGNVVLPGAPDSQVQLTDAGRVVVVPHGGRLVSVLGVEDLVVVDTPDAVLVCARDQAQDVKRLVDDLKAQGATSYL
ncbi:MAG: mannose-1-phosphate guanylyltransferase [Micromonosporaceae bacterium]|nr:mannose-1-phosphate guanylyltransferase [Micromonosporaceae bacterium]